MATSSINLLDPGLGIQNIMDPGTAGHLPDARPLASSAMREPVWMSCTTAARQPSSWRRPFVRPWATAPSSSPNFSIWSCRAP